LRNTPKPHHFFPSDHTLQATALVHEAYVKLLEQRSVDWKSRAHFFGIAAQMIIRILIDRARGHLRDKRGDGERPVPLDENFAFSPEQSEELIKLDQALEQLARSIRDRAKLWNCDSSGG
jgi:RNA polymerase sigma-70 factor, ECF subfamily